MEEILEKSTQKINLIKTGFVRSLMDKIAWDKRLIGIKGARGVGKTTLLLQYLKLRVPTGAVKLYASLDALWFSQNNLLDLADWFVKSGGTHLFLDEVHKYDNWSREIKNIYDDYPQLNVVFTGSSLLEIRKAKADLSRRAIIYHMKGLSFREYLNIEHKSNFPIISLDELLNDHVNKSKEILSTLRPLQYFKQYLQSGYYPFYRETSELYHQQIEEVVNVILENELPQIKGLDYSFIGRIKQLLQIIAESVPFVPNIKKLSERIGINRNTLVKYLYYLEEAELVINLYKEAKGITKLQKPSKIFLQNTNLQYALAEANTNVGNVRETFFANQTQNVHILEYNKKGDFILDKKYIFEVGGKGKGDRQIKSISKAYIAADDLEHGFQNKIPLYLFGFLY